LVDVHYGKFAKSPCIINECNTFCVTALPRKILIAILVVFFNPINVTFLFWQYLWQFLSKFHNFWNNLHPKIIT